MVVLPVIVKKARRFSQAQVPKGGGSVDANGGVVAVGQHVSKDVMVIAQELKIVQSLACNDVNMRNKQIRQLRKWLQLRARSSFSFTEDDFLRIWKGLYYNMWMSDKPLVQEDLAEQLGQLLNCFDDSVELSVNFFGAFLHTMCHQWFGIDQWRMDKFLMLVRRMLRHMLGILKAAKWSAVAVNLFNDHMMATVLSEDVTATGLVMHFLDIFFEELAKVSQGQISGEEVGAFVRPFIAFMATQRDGKLIAHCRTRVFYHLLYQSTLGREYSEKYNAWKAMGFPTASIDDLERVQTADSADTDDDSEGETVETQRRAVDNLDPRAGDVDVFMPELPVDGKCVSQALEDLLCKRDAMRTKCRNTLRKLLAVFQSYQNGEFPLGVKTMPRFEAKTERPLIQEKIAQLENLETEMFSTGRKLKQLNKHKRRKLLKSLDFTTITEANFEQTIEKAIPMKYILMERRKRAQAAVLSGWHEEEIDPIFVGVSPKKRKSAGSSHESATAATNLGSLDMNADAVKAPSKAVVPGTIKATAAAKTKRGSNAHTTVVSSVAVEAPAKSFDPGTIKATTAAKTKKRISAEPVLVATVSSTAVAATTPKNKKKALGMSASWTAPLAEGEVEYFIPSRKLQLKQANADMVRNPLALAGSKGGTPTSAKKIGKRITHTALNTSKSELNMTLTNTPQKRVKIVLKHNTAQNPIEYLHQVKNSPDVPYDALRKPGKGLLKPNAMPSPINPFYKKKIGLRLRNDDDTK